MKVGVIGYGYWGPNLVRNFAETAGCEVVAVSDLDQKRLEVAKTRHPGIWVSTDHGDLFSDPSIDAIAIATPVASHCELALSALSAGKHVFIEKPLAQSVDEAAQMVAEAERRNLILHVDHTFLYTGAVRKAHELISSGELGKLYYYDSVRINLGLFQHDVDVIWDLAVHDISIMDYLLDSKPVAVSATGMSHVEGKPADVAFLTVFFDDDVIAHLHVSWLAPVKVRRTLIGGNRKMIVYDDLEPSEKIKIYDKGITALNGDPEKRAQTMISYRSGDMYAPKLDMQEALRLEARHFLECVENGQRPLSDGHAGLRVVRILEAAKRSLAEKGRPVRLDWFYGGSHERVGAPATRAVANA